MSINGTIGNLGLFDGEAVVLGKLLGLMEQDRFGEQSIACIGELEPPQTLAQFAAWMGGRLQRIPLVIGDNAKNISKVAWCSGGAQGYFEAAIAQGADAYISGEISEQSFHLAQESGVAFIAAGRTPGGALRP